ncbi:MAG: thiolase family protein [Candidatus Nanopelagicales bacterium]|jgi:acetyl-CoA acyltransferase|nr:thiolase family protein [Candidatus Nanopelagicales bacterium]
MRDAVIVEAVRTPVGIGKPGKGVLSGIHPVDVSAEILHEVVHRAGIESHLVDDVYWGCVAQVGEQSTNIGRNAALAAGFPQSVTGTTIDRQCGSSQQAVAFAAASVISGNSDIIIAGGVESMSRVPMFSNMAGGDGPFSPEMLKHYPHLIPQGLSAEMIAEQWALSRQQLDEIAAISQQRAAKASSEGLFDSEMLPIAGVNVDQGIRLGTTIETLSALKPAFSPEGVVTAGNASQISDGSAALLVMTSERAKELGLHPIVRVHTNVMAGVDPVIMLTGPIPATEKILAKSGLSLGDIGVFEVNEAFASVLGAWLKDTGADHGITNPNGGAIALGHPLGASGARIMTTLVHHMQRNNIKYGLQTMCEGGGMANATILELL